MARRERAGQIALHGLRFRRAVSPSLGVVTCASRRKSLSAGAGRWRDCSSLTLGVAALVRQAGSVAQLALGAGCDAGWGRAGF